jgi:hypothetical protein
MKHRKPEAAITSSHPSSTLMHFWSAGSDRSIVSWLLDVE